MFHLQFYMSEAGEKAERSLGVEELLFILCSSHMEVRVHLWFVLETHVLAVLIDLLCYLGLKLIQYRVTIKTTKTPWVLPYPRAHLNAINMSLHLNFNTEAYFFLTWHMKNLRYQEIKLLAKFMKLMNNETHMTLNIRTHVQMLNKVYLYSRIFSHHGLLSPGHCNWCTYISFQSPRETHTHMRVCARAHTHS